MDRKKSRINFHCDMQVVSTLDDLHNPKDNPRSGFPGWGPSTGYVNMTTYYYTVYACRRFTDYVEIL